MPEPIKNGAPKGPYLAAEGAPGGIDFRRFLLPKLTRKYALRLVIVIVFAYVFFRYVAIPVYIRGDSMAPTYRSGTFNFCWRPGLLFSDLRRGDVVMVRFAGTKVMLLKRVVAFEGETVEFRDGDLLINGEKLEEPYLPSGGDWNLSPRTVESGNVYVVGDNRLVPISAARFGQTSEHRVMGRPLW